MDGDEAETVRRLAERGRQAPAPPEAPAIHRKKRTAPADSIRSMAMQAILRRAQAPRELAGKRPR
eukprot:11080812-Heterocapsa_arctica.AAC.1